MEDDKKVDEDICKLNLELLLFMEIFWYFVVIYNFGIFVVVIEVCKFEFFVLML